jgi:predicted transcriptional regulator
MPKPAVLPTEAELQVLRVLWRRGPSTAGAVHEALYGDSEVGYTTALKLLQNLHGKGLVERDESRRPHRYAALAREDDTLRRVVRRVIDRTFEGSAAALAMQALGAKRATREELESLRELIRRLEAEEAAG